MSKEKMTPATVLFGIVALVSSCSDNRVSNVDLAANRQFYDLPVTEQEKAFRRRPLADQLQLFFFGNQKHHPPAVYLSPCFAINGLPAVRLLRATLRGPTDDLSVRDIATLLATIDMMGEYRVAEDKELVALLSDRISRMKDKSWQEIAQNAMFSLGKRRTEAARGAPECS